MQYLNKSFSVPCTDGKVSQEEWDRIFQAKKVLENSDEFKRLVKNGTIYNADGFFNI